MNMEPILELSKHVLVCFDLITPVSKVKRDIETLATAVGEMGLKVECIDFGPNLFLNGELIENPLEDKMILTLKKRKCDEEVLSFFVYEDLLTFFEHKVCPDPVEEEKSLT